MHNSEIDFEQHQVTNMKRKLEDEGDNASEGSSGVKIPKYGSKEENVTETFQVGNDDEEEFNRRDRIFGVFLKNIYPLDIGMIKNVTVGVFEELQFSAGVLLNNVGKTVLLSKMAWDDLSAKFETIENFLLEQKSGKCTRILVGDMNIEADIIKIYGKPYIRIKDGNSQSDKVMLNSTDFAVLKIYQSAIDRYLEQLAQSADTISDYLFKTVRNYNTMLEPTDVEPSIYNRLPFEVAAYNWLKPKPGSTVPTDQSVEVLTEDQTPEEV